MLERRKEGFLVFLHLFLLKENSFPWTHKWGLTETQRHLDTWSESWTGQLIRVKHYKLEGSGLQWCPLPGTRCQGSALAARALPLSVSEAFYNKILFLKLTSVVQ